MLALLALVSLASASSLDMVEIAGPWGSPNSTDGTAMWWNPAGLATGRGTRFHLEGAPLTGHVHYDRTDELYGGRTTLRQTTVVPFAGLATDLGVDGLGLGAAFAIPFARGGNQTDGIPFVRDYDGPVPFDGAPGRYHARRAQVQVAEAMIGGGYDFGRVSIGAGAALMFSSWQATLDNSLTVDLYDQITELRGTPPEYTDDMIEDPRYATTLDFGTLHATAFTFNVGTQVEVVPEKVQLAVAYHHSANTNHTGDLTMRFACPPQDDSLGRFGSEAFGLCNSDINAAGAVAYQLPSRLYGGVKISPTEMLDLELMGGLVTWSRFQDFDITISEVETRNDAGDFNNLEGTAEIVNQHRLWARDNHNTGWIALDGKLHKDAWTAGLRATYDGSAVPDSALLVNNQDASQVIVSALGGYELSQNLSVGLTFSQYFLATRTITDSAFGMTLDEESRKADRYFYPHGNGTYRGGISRLGISLRGHFGGDNEG